MPRVIDNRTAMVRSSRGKINYENGERIAPIKKEIPEVPAIEKTQKLLSDDLRAITDEVKNLTKNLQASQSLIMTQVNKAPEKQQSFHFSIKNIKRDDKNKIKSMDVSVREIAP